MEEISLVVLQYIFFSLCLLFNPTRGGDIEVVVELFLFLLHNAMCVAHPHLLSFIFIFFTFNVGVCGTV